MKQQMDWGKFWDDVSNSSSYNDMKKMYISADIFDEDFANILKAITQERHSNGKIRLPSCCGVELNLDEIHVVGLHHQRCAWNYYVECPKCHHQHNFAKPFMANCGCGCNRQRELDELSKVQNGWCD